MLIDIKIMQFVTIIYFLVFFPFLQGQTTKTPNYSCSQHDVKVIFELSFSNHSAENSASHCSVQKCDESNNTTRSCLTSSTPCFDYRTRNNISYCAPGIFCSLLELCNNITFTCSSNKTIYVVNSCCSSQAVCIPLIVIDFCKDCNVTLRTQETYFTDSQPLGVAVADFNGDNKADIVVANNAANNIGVLFNLGNGTFSNQTTYSTDPGPRGVTAADLNDDGNIDIIVAHTVAGHVSVYLNLGNGIFSNPSMYSTALSGSYPVYVAVGDMNNDGSLDIVAANLGYRGFTIIYNIGNGTFSGYLFRTIPGNGSNFVTLADVNNDSSLDIVVSFVFSGNFVVFINKNNGSFNDYDHISYSVGSNAKPSAIGTIDINNDGMLDLVIACTNLNAVLVYLNSGNGTFYYSQQSYTTNDGPVSLATADVNGDNQIDSITSNNYNNTISVLLNLGDGTFANQTTYMTDMGPYAITTGDVNNDGYDDIIVGNQNSNNVGVFISYCD